MARTAIDRIPLVGVIVAVILLAVSTYRYSGDLSLGQITVSRLCAATLPDGSPNFGRELPIVALLILCASMAFLYHQLSQLAETRLQHDAIQIGGIGSQVYSLLTATRLHNLMVNIAAVFTIVAMIAIVMMLFRKGLNLLAILGLACLLMGLGYASLYYADIHIVEWGILQKLSFAFTTTWLLAVHMTVKSRKVAGGTV
jgi:hypothetical protein